MNARKKKLIVIIIEYLKMYRLYITMISIFYSYCSLCCYFLLLLIFNKKIQCCAIVISVKKNMYFTNIKVKTIIL